MTKPKPKRARDLGKTDEDYFRQLADQDGKCAVSGCNRTPKTRRFHFDHNHATQRDRGLLCHWHNRIMPRDSSEALALAAYLARYEDDGDSVGQIMADLQPYTMRR